MPGKNKTPLLGWHASAEVSAWVRAEAERRSVPIAVVLEEIAQAAMSTATIPNRQETTDG